MPPKDPKGPKGNPHPGTPGKRRGASQDVYSVSHVNEDVMDILDEALDEGLTPPSPWPAIGSAIPNVVIVIKVLAASVSAGQLQIKGWDVPLLLGCAFAAIVIVTNYGVAVGKRNRLVKLAKKKLVKLREALAALDAAEREPTAHVRVGISDQTAEDEADAADESLEDVKTRN